MKHLRDNSLLVAHGTEDRHVHVSHTWALTQALVEAGVLFRQMIYPNTSLAESGPREHLHHTLEKYFKDVRLADNVTLCPMFDCSVWVSVCSDYQEIHLQRSRTCLARFFIEVFKSSVNLEPLFKSC